MDGNLICPLLPGHFNERPLDSRNNKCSGTNESLGSSAKTEFSFPSPGASCRSFRFLGERPALDPRCDPSAEMLLALSSTLHPPTLGSQRPSTARSSSRVQLGLAAGVSLFCPRSRSAFAAVVSPLAQALIYSGHLRSRDTSGH